MASRSAVERLEVESVSVSLSDDGGKKEFWLAGRFRGGLANGRMHRPNSQGPRLLKRLTVITVEMG